MHNYFWAYVFGAIGLALLVFMIPMYRQQLAKSKLPLEQRYAKEIANGEAVIIPKDPAYFKKKLLLATIGIIGALPVLGFNRYISDLNQRCTELLGWNSLMIMIASLFIITGIGALAITIVSIRNYQKILHDGYSPSRETKVDKDQIAFKLTPKIKTKEQFKLAAIFIFSICLISIPTMISHILMNTPKHKLTSIYELNELIQKVCLEDLSKKADFQTQQK